MSTLYLDLFSGISGDMFLGALIDLGVDFDRLEAELRRLPLTGYHLHRSGGQKSLITGTKFDVHLSPPPHTHEHVHADGKRHEHEHDHDHDHDQVEGHHHTHADSHLAHGRDYSGIRHMIESSALSAWVKTKAIAVFHRIAEAEGRIHGVPPDQVHFHEVGAIDSIVDIVGTCIALEQLGKPRLLASPVVEGSGWVDCAHGRFPVPAPATLAILAARGVPLSQCDEPHEMVTPTGAALLAEFVEEFGLMRDLRPQAVGYGMGTRDHQTRPNVLRVILAETGSGAAPVHDWEVDTIVTVEANLDDTNAEILGHFLQRAMDAGALDVCHTAIQMKKNRPGVRLTVLCAADQADRFAELILTETTAFGVRIHETQRRKLRRETVSVATPLGEISVKLGRLDGRVVQAAPEYESARALAERIQVPLKTVYEIALQHLRPT